MAMHWCSWLWTKIIIHLEFLFQNFIDGTEIESQIPCQFCLCTAGNKICKPKECITNVISSCTHPVQVRFFFHAVGINNFFSHDFVWEPNCINRLDVAELVPMVASWMESRSRRQKSFLIRTIPTVYIVCARYWKQIRLCFYWQSS